MNSIRALEDCYGSYLGTVTCVQNHYGRSPCDRSAEVGITSSNTNRDMVDYPALPHLPDTRSTTD
jgi:hypothetical protein